MSEPQQPVPGSADPRGTGPGQTQTFPTTPPSGAWGQQPGGYPPPSYPGAGHPAYQQPTFPQPGWGPEAPPAAAPRRDPGRMRMGVAGLVAGALIGGAAGAGTVQLMDRPTTVSSGSPAAGQSVVIKNPATATTATAAAAKAGPSVVTIYVTSGSAAGSGSGVVLTADGYVLTNNHVVTLEGSGSGNVQVRAANGTLYDATVVGADASADLAVIKLKGATGLSPATFADSSKVQVGDAAIAIGAPLGLSNTVTDGIISATNRAVATGSTRTDATVIDAVQTDAPINPGNSGGALVDGAGQVIGINTAIASVASEGAGGQQSQSGNIGVGFAIPSNTAKRIADQIVKTGSATHAVLGVSARTATSGSNSQAGTGAQVASLQRGGPAEAAGLQTGDVIVAVNDRAVTTSTELTAAVRSASPGSKVTVTVRRGNDTRNVEVTLAETAS